MNRRFLATAAAMMSLSALFLSTPTPAEGRVCPPSDSTCQSFCPGNLISFCDYTFRFTHCTTQSASCSHDGLCPDESNANCCNIYTLSGCDGINPYCALEHVTCNFY